MGLDAIFPDTIGDQEQNPAFKIPDPARVSGRKLRFALSAAAAVALLAALSPQGAPIRLAFGAAAASAILFLAIRYAYHHPEWLIVGLVIEETLPYLNVIPVDPFNRWFLRYPILLPLTIPAALIAFRSPVLWQGRFKYMLLFWLWALLTVPYSLAPAISLGRVVPDMLVFATLCAIALQIESAVDVQKLLQRFFLACAVLECGLAIAYLCLPEVLGGSGPTVRATWILDESGLYRFTGLFSDANSVGALLMATLISGLAQWESVKSYGKRLFIVSVIAAGFFFAIIADSRSETAAGVIGCVGYVVWKRGLKGSVVLLMVLAAIAAVYVNLSPSNRLYFNRDVSTLTGRTEAWQFELKSIEAQPLLGYGYEVEGEIFQSKYFTNWQDFWALGVNTSLHNGYTAVAVGMGLPALLFWLFSFVGPWVKLWRDKSDSWNLKPLIFFILIPSLLLGFDESGLAEPRTLRGLLLFACWAIVERYNVIQAVAAKAAESTEHQPVSILAETLAGCTPGRGYASLPGN